MCEAVVAITTNLYRSVSVCLYNGQMKATRRQVNGKTKSQFQMFETVGDCQKDGTRCYLFSVPGLYGKPATTLNHLALETQRIHHRLLRSRR